VKWVWNPNYGESSGAAHHWTEYYPGDNYVDWVGIDMYQSGDNVDPAQEMASLYNDYGARKPVGIFEWGVNAYAWSGVNTPDAKRAEYMNKFFDAVEARSNVKLISYWYIYSFKFDAASTPLTTAKYSNRVANSVYVSK
jgi:beta-mannanase